MRRAGTASAEPRANAVGEIPQEAALTTTAFNDAVWANYHNNDIHGWLHARPSPYGTVVPLQADGNCPPNSDPAGNYGQADTCMTYPKCPTSATRNGDPSQPSGYMCTCPDGRFIDPSTDTCVVQLPPDGVAAAAWQFFVYSHGNPGETTYISPSSVKAAVASANRLWESMHGLGNIDYAHLGDVDFSVPFSSVPWDWMVNGSSNVQWKIVESAITHVMDLAKQKYDPSTWNFTVEGMLADTAPPFRQTANWEGMNWTAAIPGSASPWSQAWRFFDVNDSNLSHIPWWTMPWAAPGFADKLRQATTTADVVTLVTTTLTERFGLGSGPVKSGPCTNAEAAAQGLDTHADYVWDASGTKCVETHGPDDPSGDEHGNFPPGTLPATPEQKAAAQALFDLAKSLTDRAIDGNKLDPSNGLKQAASAAASAAYSAAAVLIADAGSATKLKDAQDAYSAAVVAYYIAYPEIVNENKTLHVPGTTCLPTDLTAQGIDANSKGLVWNKAGTDCIDAKAEQNDGGGGGNGGASDSGSGSSGVLLLGAAGAAALLLYYATKSKTKGSKR